jgi:hypothetical protein
VVLPSLFEEELVEAGPDAYLSLVAEARKTLEIPAVVSLNGVSRGGWSSYATRLEEAGDAARRCW